MPFTLYSAGSNAKGQLANGSLDDASEFAPCHFHPTAAVSHKVGAEEQGEPNFKLWADVRQVTSGANHTLLLLQSHQAVINHLYAAGDPSRGQLGPALADSPTPQSSFQRVQLHLERADHHVVRIAAAWETSYFVFRHTDDRKLTSDVLVSVGANDFGDLGNPAPSSRPNPQSKGKGKQPTSLEHIVTFDHLLQDPHRTRYRIDSLTAGVHHVIALLEIGIEKPPPHQFMLVGWGAHRHDQLGPFNLTAPTLPPPPPPPSRPSANKPNPKHQNQNKKLKSGASSPAIIFHLDSPVLLNLSPYPNPSTSLANIRRIAVGAQHTSISYGSGVLTSWGSNRKGQRAELETLSGVVDVGCTWNGTYAIVNNKLMEDSDMEWSLLATGSGEKGQLGRVYRSPLASSTATSSNSTQTQDLPPENERGLAPVDLPLRSSPSMRRRVRKMACGSEHILLLLECGERPLSAENSGMSANTELDPTPLSVETELWAWGWNEHGNLGLGHEDDVFTPVRIPCPSTPGARGASPETNPLPDRIVDVWAGCGTSWILVECD